MRTGAAALSLLLEPDWKVSKGRLVSQLGVPLLHFPGFLAIG